MFTFGFTPELDDSLVEAAENKKTERLTSQKEPTWLESEEVTPKEDELEKYKEMLDDTNLMLAGDNEVIYLNPVKVIDNCSTVIKAANSQHSDLVKGVYEGGLKVWECTQDLAEYLSAELNEETGETRLHNFDGKLVLDLGCGSGILGILAMKFGASVHFQDYNTDVLTSFTIPNVVLNLEDLADVKKTKFYSGDWLSFDKLCPDTKYDVILTSETIYNIANNQKLLDVLRNKLKPDGVIYLAGKTYYFGVGGSIRQFEKLIAENGILKAEVVWSFSEGVQREILRIGFADKIQS